MLKALQSGAEKTQHNKSQLVVFKNMQIQGKKNPFHSILTGKIAKYWNKLSRNILNTSVPEAFLNQN